ncbi:homeodomain-interacting protein kinase 1-like [Limanda limanda]|uniref:homeodomain-interacting protein kinase 1-like n=1 Tax=Limanda limanda TaxID=27771 RepID=UPI0029C60087|nr:homeodomain-interacting protein kinase 1-like [Limanda limanda]
MAATLTAQDYQLVPGSLLTSSSSCYQVQSFLGQGTCGKVVKCKRLDDKTTVAIKMIKLKGCYVKAANKEVAALKKLRSLGTFYLVQWYQYFVDKGHICLEFEHLDKSLFDFMRERRFRPLQLKEIRPIVQQIAHALNHLKAAGIVHADLKLDNIMLVDQLREPFRVKVIDFGLACEVSAAKLGSYIQTRPYRSPEIMLGHPFTEAIDMWSLGCIAAALYLGTQLYPGLGEYEMIKHITETQGQLPDTMLNHGGKTPQFFTRNVDSTSSVWKLKTPEEYHKEMGKQPMENRWWKFTSLNDLLLAILQLDPDRRITPRQVLEHKFISLRHIARMEHKSHYVRCCFQMMEICQKKILTPGSGTAVCGPLKPPRCTATNPVQQNPPSLAEGRKTGQPHRTDLHPCTTSTQTRGTEGSRKRKIEHDDRNGPADHRHNHNTGPSGSSRTEGQALSGLKRKGGDHGDVPPPKRNSPPRSDSNRRSQGNWDYSRSRDCERRRDRHDFTGSSTCRDDSRHTRHHQSAQRTRPYEHHHHHNTVPSGCTLT